MLNTVLYPLEYAVAWIMVQFHAGLTSIGLPEASGWTWALSIVGLVVVIRIILIPLFVKQIKASRGLQLIQPEMKKIQAKYKDKKDPESRQAMTQETMALYKDTGTNPFASCLPILLQAPIFFALFRVLNDKIQKGTGIGPLTPRLAQMADGSTLLGAQLSSTFTHANGNLNVQIITVVLIVLMSASTFTTQRQLMMKNMPASALDNPFAQQQKILLYVLPLVFAVSGINFPIGVLLYWLTTNVWSMGQQFYVIRRMPAPGSLAEQALNDRRRRKGQPTTDSPPSGDVSNHVSTGDASKGAVIGQVVGESPRQRQQPKRQPRSKRVPSTGLPPAADEASPQKRTGAHPARVQPTRSGSDTSAPDTPVVTKVHLGKEATGRPDTRRARGQRGADQQHVNPPPGS